MNPSTCSCACNMLRATAFTVPTNGELQVPSTSFLGTPPPRSRVARNCVTTSTGRDRRRSLVVEASAGFAMGGAVSGGGLGQIVNGLAAVVGAGLIARELLSPASSGIADEDACPTCRGSGYEECMCTRWSDNDVGCGICGNTREMKCRGCGGGGTKVPIACRIPADSRNRNDPM